MPVAKVNNDNTSLTFFPVTSLSGSAAFIRVLTVPTVAASKVDIDGLVVMRSSYGKSLNELNGTIAIFPNGSKAKPALNCEPKNQPAISNKNVRKNCRQSRSFKGTKN